MHPESSGAAHLVATTGDAPDHELGRTGQLRGAEVVAVGVAAAASQTRVRPPKGCIGRHSVRMYAC